MSFRILVWLAARFLKFAFAKFGLSCLLKRPGHSPDLNPQENVWACAEETRRDDEKDRDSLEVFEKRVLEACRAYLSGGKLVGSMAKRMKLLLEKEGANIGK